MSYELYVAAKGANLPDLYHRETEEVMNFLAQSGILKEIEIQEMKGMTIQDKENFAHMCDPDAEIGLPLLVVGHGPTAVIGHSGSKKIIKTLECISTK